MDTHVLLGQGFMEKSHSQDVLREEGAPPCLRTKQLCHFVEQANVSSQGTELTAWVLRKINGLDFQFKGNRCF